MHTLNYITTVIEHSPDVFRVYRTSEMGIAIVLAVATGRTNTLKPQATNKLEHVLNRG